MTDFNNAINLNISMVKGDTMSFGFELQGLEREKPDKVNFACKEQIDDEDYIFNKDLTDGVELDSYDELKDLLTYIVRVAPEDTASVDIGQYFYDLSVSVNGDVFTLMRGKLTIVWEVNENVQ